MVRKPTCPSRVAVAAFFAAMALAAALSTALKPAIDTAVRRYPLARDMLSYQPKDSRTAPEPVSSGSYNFARVWAYLFLLFFVAGCLAKRKSIQLGSLLREGYAIDARPWRDLGAGLLVSLLTVSLLTGALWLAGQREARPLHEIARRLEGGTSVLSALGSALGAGVPEETLFRVVLLGALLRDRVVWRAMLAANALFVLPHFFSGTAMAEFGFQPWAGVLTPLSSAVGVLASRSGWVVAVNIFAIGAILCLAFAWSRRVYLPLGLHTGWVFAQKMSYDLAGATTPESARWIFGGRRLTDGVAMLALIPPVLVWVWWWTREERDGNGAK